jgi:hypothetical protein
MRQVQIKQIEGRLKVSRTHLKSLPAGDYTIGGCPVTVQRGAQGLVIVKALVDRRIVTCSFR